MRQEVDVSKVSMLDWPYIFGEEGEMMKKRSILAIGVLALLVIVTYIWYHGETVFLSSVSSEDISVITVRSGFTGHRFTISTQEDIDYIVENIQSSSFHKDGISLFRMGSGFTMSFSDKHGNVVSEFILNGPQYIRKDPFFYQTENGDIQNVMDYLSAIDDEAK